MLDMGGGREPQSPGNGRVEHGRQKELKNSYKDKPETGGIYLIRCAGSGQVWLKAAQNLQGRINRFNFSVLTGACPESDLRADWEKYGPQSFSLTVLEELQKGEKQTDREFGDDIDALYQMHLERRQEDAPGGVQ